MTRTQVSPLTDMVAYSLVYTSLMPFTSAESTHIYNVHITASRLNDVKKVKIFNDCSLSLPLFDPATQLVDLEEAKGQAYPAHGGPQSR